MIIIIAALIGAIIGGTMARRRKGRTADILQYATVYAMLFGLIGLFVTILIARLLI